MTPTFETRLLVSRVGVFRLEAACHVRQWIFTNCNGLWENCEHKLKVHDGQNRFALCAMRYAYNGDGVHRRLPLKWG
jgi:hypothetical protein